MLGRIAISFSAVVLWSGASTAVDVFSAVPSGINVRTTAAGAYLTDLNGLTLYVTERDRSPNASICIDECALQWPPMLASDLGFSGAHWSVLIRGDGTQQWVWNGQPLYRHAKDSHAGASLGDGAVGAWQVAFAPIDLPAGLTLRRTLAGRVIADSRGFTLYWRGNSGSEKNIGLLSDYKPLAAPGIAKAEPPWSVAIRPDGSKQWAYDGRPLYTNERDRKPGDIEGHGTDASRPDGTWEAAALEPPPATPFWVTIQMTETGPALANAQGLTLYVARSIEQIKRQKTCLEDCMDTFMLPVLANANENPVGNWSIALNDDGQRQWRFNDAPVFIHSRDKKPGDSIGAGFAVGPNIRGGFWPIMQNTLLPTQ